MKKCPKCGTSYDARINFCFRDGTHLGTKTSVVGTPKMVATSLSGTSDPTDRMQTLDNINLDDLLQIGQPTPTFSGFDFSLPMEAPASKDGDTLIMSRNDFSELTEDANPPEESNQHELDLDLDNLDTLDFELDQLSDDIDAHLEDTLDGVQVGQLLNESSLDFSTNTSEIQPGDTLDLIADELGLPEATESDIRTVDTKDTLDDDFDQWEASGPVMQQAAREALRQRQALHEDTPVPDSEPTSQVDVDLSEKSNRSILMFGVAAIVVGFIGVLVLTNDEPTSNAPIKTQSSMGSDNGVVKKLDIPEPTYKKNSEKAELPAEKKSVNVADPKENNPEKATKAIVSPSPSEQTIKSSGKNQGSSTQPAVVKPVVKTQKSTPKKATPPTKPKTVPKPMPKKEKKKVQKVATPAPSTTEDTTQSIGWGDVSTCELMVRSNISTATVYINGSKRGKVGTKIPLDCTNYAIEVKADGYITSTRQVTLVEDATFTMNLER